VRKSAITALGGTALLAAGCGASRTPATISAPAGSTLAAGTASASPAATHHAQHLGPSATVRAYFKAINRHDYGRAWRLGGRYIGGSYAAFDPDSPHRAGLTGAALPLDRTSRARFDDAGNERC
jgi:hypothetical protein